MSCDSLDHGAALCDARSLQEEYFKSLIQPDALHPYGLDPIYGGNALAILGFSSAKEFETARKNQTLNSAVKKAIAASLAESKRLRVGGKPQRETTYPVVRH